MAMTGTLTKVLALAGTIFAWLPILAPILFSLIGSVARHMFRFDYLMPAELFPLAFAGSALLLWAALRARRQRALIGGGLAAMLALLIAGQALAMITGLASGVIEPQGWPWILVLASLAGYVLALALVGCGGVLLLRELHQQGKAGGAVLPEA